MEGLPRPGRAFHLAIGRIALSEVIRGHEAGFLSPPGECGSLPATGYILADPKNLEQTPEMLFHRVLAQAEGICDLGVGGCVTRFAGHLDRSDQFDQDLALGLSDQWTDVLPPDGLAEAGVFGLAEHHGGVTETEQIPVRDLLLVDPDAVYLCSVQGTDVLQPPAGADLDHLGMGF